MKKNFSLVCIILVSSCVQSPDFSEVPKISYNSISQETVLDASGQKVQEKVILTINFEDGDGDLGATAEDRNGAYQDAPNYELTTITKQPDGSWLETILAEDLPKWMPVLKTDGKSGPIQGKLEYAFTYNYGNSTVPLTRRFKIRVRDRASHFSNQTAESDTIVVPGYR